MSEWQPIETAPKDGARILLFGICVANGANCFRSDPQCAVGVYGKLDPKYAAYSAEWRQDPEDYYPIDIEATHWMPLPEPPKCQ